MKTSTGGEKSLHWGQTMVRVVLRIWAVIPFLVRPGGGIDSPTANATQQPAPGVRTVDINSLKFDTPELRKRFADFDAVSRRFAAVGFDHQPYQLRGNFVSAVWAKGVGAGGDLSFSGPRHAPKSMHRITVETIVVPFPRAKAAGLAVEVVAPDPDGWCVGFSYREATEQSVAGPEWGISFYRWDPARLGAVVPFLPRAEAREQIVLPLRNYGVGDGGVSLRSDLPVGEDFLRHMRSPGAMRDAYLADLDRLRERTVAFIRSHRARKKVYGEYEGRGLPPPYHLEPLTAAEEKAELDRAERYFAVQAKLMRDHHEAMYAAWRGSFAVERCWPDLVER